MPAIVVGSLFLSFLLPGAISGFYFDTVLPFLVSMWIGSGFTYAWDSLRASAHQQRFTPGMLALTGLLCSLFFFLMLGFDWLWHDPWLFGVAIAPGFALARPWLEGRLNTRRAAKPN
jgi:hypothetical protein